MPYLGVDVRDRYAPEGRQRIVGGGVCCEACGKPTAERKPMCSDHIGLMPYAAKVIAEVEAMERVGRVA